MWSSKAVQGNLTAAGTSVTKRALNNGGHRMV